MFSNYMSLAAIDFVDQMARGLCFTLNKALSLVIKEMLATKDVTKDVMKQIMLITLKRVAR